MICGEAIALAHGYKLLGSEAGFHARAIECLVIYTDAYQPGLGIYARRFQALRATRNAMKYDRTPPGEGQLKQYLAAAEAFYAAQRELDGIVALQVGGRQRVLPVWHGLNHDDMLAYSPTLADTVAARTSDSTIKEIAAEIARVVRGI